MNNSERQTETGYLKCSLIAYLLLGITDTVHHYHAAVALGPGRAMHAVWTGVVLVPIALVCVVGFLALRHKALLWGFVSIAALAAVLPGLYHGGWDHLLKILAHLRLEGDETDIRLLFPMDNPDLWFYEVTGALEFFMSLAVLYWLFRLIFALR